MTVPTTAGNFGTVTDKIALGYLPSYLRIAAELGPSARVLELGVWNGDSLRLWQQLFAFGEVTGVDSEMTAVWPPGARKVLRNVRDPELPQHLNGPYDLIVDDASHYGADVTTAFTGLWPLLAPGGYYVVEDWWLSFPDNPYHPQYGGEGMLEAVQALLRLLHPPQTAEVDEIIYRYGLAIVHKRRL